MWKKKKKEGKGLFKDLKKEKKSLFPHVKKESKTAEWIRIKNEIRPFFEEHGLYNICELKLDVCIGNSLELTFAHSKKRGDIAKIEPERTRELKEVVRACTACHHKIEYIPKEEGGRKKMYQIVVETINRRNRRLGL